MKCSLVTIDIALPKRLDLEFPGSVFRGWLGNTLKCDPGMNCSVECSDHKKCPYYMVFKEEIDVKPFSTLSIPYEGGIRNFIKIYGDRRKFAPRILTMIHEHENSRHFGGLPYTIESIQARIIELPRMQLKDMTEVIFTTPTHLTHEDHQELLPDFAALMRSCVRSYNRIAKYYDEKNYPCRVPPEMLDSPADILDYTVRTVNILHQNRYDHPISLEGIVGSISYDTSEVAPEAGNILKMGEFLQIGKHSTYGFGGIVVKQGMCTS